MAESYDPHLRPVLGALLVAAAPHVTRLPLWIILWSAGIWGYILLALKTGKPRPGRWPLLFLTLIGFFGTLISFRGGLYNDTWVALLTVTVSLKLLEIRNRRDLMVALFLTYFMVITSLLYSDSLIMTGYMFLSVLITTAVLIHLHHPSGTVRTYLKLSGTIILQALPLVVILFVLFPRVQSSFLGLTRRSSGSSGFSDTMQPGSLSNLVQNNETAFRVQFSGPIPEPDHLYWRGLTFSLFDGRGWRKTPRVFYRNRVIAAEKPVEYAITLEPHRDRWLFALDMPTDVSDAGVILGDFTLMARKPVNERVLYRVRSVMAYTTGITAGQEQDNLQLPESGNPEARALARKWAQSGNAESVIRAALGFFGENGFVYTLQPPLLGADPVDQFLFRTRKGYCEHYASAFVFLMRAAGIPARVVGGYLGGEINPYGDYLIVRQSHAHAWAEALLPGKGWTRVDPTSVVAPDRISLGAAEALSPEDRSLMTGFDFGPVSDWFRTARLGWDVVNTYWNFRVMGYSFQEQSSLLSWIGIRTDSRKWVFQAALVAAGLIFPVMLFFAVRIYRKTGESQDPARRIYGQFCRKLARIGIPRKPEQGPMDYARQVIRERPDMADAVTDITALYVRLRYENSGSSADLKKFRALVRAFRAGKRNRRSGKLL